VIGVPVGVCMRCGHRVFPDRLLCPVCGGGDWRREWLVDGVVEEVTLLHRSPGNVHEPPVRLATVRLGSHVRVVARLESDLPPGSRVAVDLVDAAVVARRPEES
jgi:uncharacterized OB-fold protein